MELFLYNVLFNISIYILNFFNQFNEYKLSKKTLKKIVTTIFIMLKDSYLVISGQFQYLLFIFGNF